MDGNCFIWCVLTGGLSEFVQVNLPFLYPKKTHSNAGKNFSSVKGHVFVWWILLPPGGHFSIITVLDWNLN